jgi:hypothetical protein
LLFCIYSEKQNAYRFWSKSSLKFIVSRDATFHEFQQAPPDSSVPATEDVGEISDELAVRSPLAELPLPPRVRKQVKPISALLSELPLAADTTLVDDEPAQYADAIASEDSDLWRTAMEIEIAGLNKNNTWRLMELPKGRTAVRCRWTYKFK